MNKQDLLDLQMLLDEFVRANYINKCNEEHYTIADIRDSIDLMLGDFKNGLEDQEDE